MKFINWGNLGGYPLAQDDLQYLQKAWDEMIEAIGAMGGSGPYIVTGCAVSNVLVGGTVYTYTIAAGWVYYEGLLQRVPGNSINVDTSVNAPYLQLSTADTTLPFYNGSTPGVLQDTTGAMVSEVAGTANTATLFALSGLIAYGVSLGIENRPAWATLAVSSLSAAGGVTGSIYYKKDTIANTLLLRFSLTVNDPYNLVAAPAATAYVIQTMPAGFYNSGHDIDFIIGVGAQDGSNNTVKDDAGVSWIRQAQVAISNTGDINIFLMKPAVGCTVYNVYGMVVLPLD